MGRSQHKHPKIRLGPRRMLPLFVVLLAILLSAVQPVAADAGDVIAGIIGALIGIVVILGLIGWLVRNRRL